MPIINIITIKFPTNKKINYFCHMRLLSLIISITIAISAFASEPQTQYLSYLNGFDGFRDGLRINNRLQFSNETNSPKLSLTNSQVDGFKFTIVTRFANLNNDGLKSYKVSDSKGNNYSIKKPLWGVIFNYENDSSYYAVTLQAFNAAPLDEVLGKSMLKCRLIKHYCGNDSIIADHVIANGIKTDAGDNLLIVEHSDNITTIKLGSNKPQQIIVANDINYQDRFKTGIIAYPGSKVSVERFVIKCNPDPAIKIKTRWTKDMLDEYFSKSDNPLEGYWQYLDRDVDEKQLDIGGYYKIALVKAQYGYDVIYIDGAKVNSAKWSTGLLKGHLSETIFSDEYNLVWYDSDMQAMTEELSAKIEKASLITFRFPVYNSQIRFSKIPTNN